MRNTNKYERALPIKTGIGKGKLAIRHSIGLLLTVALTQATGSAPTAQAQPLSITDQIKAAVPGNVITLAAQDYTELIDIDTSGSAEAPITLRGAGIDSTLIHGRISIRANVGHWVIENLSIDAQGVNNDAIHIYTNTQHLTIRNVQLYGGTQGGHYGIRVGDGSANILIEDAHIHDFSGGGTDAHGIGIGAADNVTVRRCRIHDNRGDGVQSNTSDDTTVPPPPRPSHILIETSEIYSNSENAVDIKSTLGIQIVNNRLYHYRPSGSSDGTAIQVQYGARDVQIIGNTISDAVVGIEVTQGKKNGTVYPDTPSRVTIQQNFIHDTVVDSAASTGSGTAITLRAGSAFKIYNNTLANIPTYGLYLGKADAAKPSDIDVRNNVLQGVLRDAEFSPPVLDISGLTFDHNHYTTGLIDKWSLTDWPAQGLEKSATGGDPQIDAQGQPQAGSPLVDSGVQLGLAFTGSAPDRGWSEATATPALTPTPGPSPTPMPARQYLPLITLALSNSSANHANLR